MEHSFLIQVLLMLVIAIVAIAVLRRLGLPAILAYLLTGVVRTERFSLVYPASNAICR